MALWTSVAICCNDRNTYVHTHSAHMFTLPTPTYPRCMIQVCVECPR